MVRTEMSRVSAETCAKKSPAKSPDRSQLGLAWIEVRRHVCWMWIKSGGTSAEVGWIQKA